MSSNPQNTNNNTGQQNNNNSNPNTNQNYQQPSNTVNIFTSSNQSNPQQSSMTTDHTLMMSNPQFGFHNGRALNVRQNFTREVINRYGDKVCVEFDPQHGMPVRYLKLSYLDTTKIPEDSSEQQIQQIFVMMEIEFERQVEQRQTSIGFSNLPENDFCRVWATIFDYKKKFSKLVRGIYKLKNEWGDWYATQLMVWGDHDLLCLGTFFSEFMDFANNYGIGLLNKSELRFNKDTQKWNCHHYHRFKFENLSFVKLLCDRKGVPKPLSSCQGIKINQVDHNE